MPSWLEPRSDPAAAFASAYHAGSQVAMEKRRLAQQAATAAMESATRAQIAHQNNLAEQQQIEVSKAYHDAQLGLRQRELDQEQQRISATAQQAAQTFQAQEQYRQRVKAGEDPNKVMLELWPSLYKGAGGFEPVARATRPFVPKAVTVDGQKMFERAPGQFAFPPKEGVDIEGRMVRMDELRHLEKQRETLDKEDANDPIGEMSADKDASKLGPAGKAARKRYLERQKQKTNLDRQIEQMRLGATGAKATLPESMTWTGTASPFKEGQTVRNKKDGKLYRIVNGQPVPIEEPSKPREEEP